jgi:hypothetical protein
LTSAQPSITFFTTVIGSFKPNISSCQSILLMRLLSPSASQTTNTGLICTAKNSSPFGREVMIHLLDQIFHLQDHFCAGYTRRMDHGVELR